MKQQNPLGDGRSSQRVLLFCRNITLPRCTHRGKKNAALVCAARFPVYNLMKSFESVSMFTASFRFIAVIFH